MQVIKTAIDGVVIIEPKVFHDQRGYFFESFSQREFDEKVRPIHFVQDNESMSSRGVMRGLHFQLPPFTQSKLVRCVKGAVLDVAVDIRKGSPTYGQHVSCLLTGRDEEGKRIAQEFKENGYSPLGKSPFKGDLEGLPRFRFPPGSKCAIYNLPILNYLKEDDELWITEGYSDCWAMLSAGKKAIAIPSATLLGHEDEERLQKLRSRLRLKWGMYPDNDVPGERLFLKLKEIIPELTRHQLLPGCKDFADYYLRLKSTEDNGQQQ